MATPITDAAFCVHAVLHLTRILVTIFLLQCISIAFMLVLRSVQGGAKNGATLSHCKYSENFMTELRGR